MEIIYFLVFIFALKCALKVMLHPIRTVKPTITRTALLQARCNHRD